jgi:adenylate cyclase
MKKMQAQLAKSGVRLIAKYRGEERESVHYAPCVTIGRAVGSSSPDLNLSPDANVSRNHARVWVEGANCFIEDLGSKFGTRVDGEEIGGRGRVPLTPRKEVKIGDTILNVEPLGTGLGGFAELPPQPATPSTIEIGKTIQSSPGACMAAHPASLEATHRQAMLLEILVQFSLPARLDQLMQTITSRVVELIPGAKRGALLLRNPASNRLVLAAFVSPNGPALSETLARRALDQREAFVWRNDFGFDPALSIQRHKIQSGMYAPLVYDGQALGVLCVDNPNTHAAFSEEDLQLLVTVADHAAVAVRHQQVEEELSSRAQALESLLWNFSPEIRARLLEKSRAGQLSVGLTRSELPILAVTFKDMAARLSMMPGADASQLAALYAETVANGVFQFNGALCADTGDSILAVFGTPEQQHDPNAAAVRAAEAVESALTALNSNRRAEGQPICAFGIAINCGELLHGFVGSPDRLQFKVVGEVLRQTREQSESAAAETVLIELLQSPQLKAA